MFVLQNCKYKDKHIQYLIQDLEKEASKFGLLDYETSCAIIPGQNGVHLCKGE